MVMCRVDPSDVEVTGITANSQDVGPGFVFAALPGTHRDGRDYIADAVTRGAAAILAPPDTAWPAGVPPRPIIYDVQPRPPPGDAGGKPGRRPAPDGSRPSPAPMAKPAPQISCASSGHSAAIPRHLSARLGLVAPGFPQGAGLTTPDPVSIAQTMAALARAGIQHAAVEASSQWSSTSSGSTGCGFRRRASPNLTRDHLDYHRQYGGLSHRQAAAVHRSFAARRAGCRRHGAGRGKAGKFSPVIAVQRGLNFRHGWARAAADPIASGQHLCPTAQRLDLSAGGRRFDVKLALPGRFQADNALVAAAIVLLLGDTAVFDRLPNLIGVARAHGAVAATLPNGAAVYIDYAHTPDAITRVLSALRPHTAGKLAIVFGAGGDRDRGKASADGAGGGQRRRSCHRDGRQSAH